MSENAPAGHPQTIATPRLSLVAATASLVRAEIEDLPRFFRLLGVQPRSDWPPEDVRDALPFFLEELETRPRLAGWLSWYWILRADAAASSADEGPRILVGSGGFKGLPVDGVVEIGYHVLAPYRRRGYATEAVGALLGWALQHEGVQGVVAETAEENVPSLALLARLGFERAADPDSEGMLRLVLWAGGRGR